MENWDSTAKIDLLWPLKSKKSTHYYPSKKYILTVKWNKIYDWFFCSFHELPYVMLSGPSFFVIIFFVICLTVNNLLGILDTTDTSFMQPWVVGGVWKPLQCFTLAYIWGYIEAKQSGNQFVSRGYTVKLWWTDASKVSVKKEFGGHHWTWTLAASIKR